MKKEPRVILFGIGNCGRADDGLGWAFLDQIKEKLPDNYDIEYRYQLQVEDAELATNYDTVLFIDAHTEIFKEGFIWKYVLSKFKHTAYVTLINIVYRLKNKKNTGDIIDNINKEN